MNRKCFLCHKKETEARAENPRSGWDWFWDVSLCPVCAKSVDGQAALEKERQRVDKLYRKEKTK